jgi:hypothetical protein
MLSIDSRSGIALLFRIIVILMIAFQLQIYLSFGDLGLLQAEGICVRFLEKVQKALLQAGPKAIHVP